MIKLLSLKLFLSLNFFLIAPLAFTKNYQNWLNDIRIDALEYGVSKKTFIDITSNLKKPNNKVLKYYNNHIVE